MYMLKVPFLPLYFSYIIKDLSDDVTCNTVICTDDTTLYSKCDLNSNLIYKILSIGIDWNGLLTSMLEKLNWFRLTSLITLVLLIWKWMGLFLWKIIFLGAGVDFLF